MKSWMKQVNMEVLFKKQEAHVFSYKIHILQKKVDEACSSNKSHTESLING